MLKFILIGLGAALVIFLIVVAFQPADFRIIRTTTIAAPPSIIFEHLNNLHQWNAWSPWARLDPNAKNSFDGPDAGVGAGFAWAGNSKVGEGRMTITGSKPVEQVVMRLEFLKPFAATNMTDFTLKSAGEKTTLVWSMTGHNNFIGKAMSLIMNCDKMVGGQFEQGFANLKSIVEEPVRI